MTDAVGGSLWKVGVDTSAVEKGLSSTAAKSQALGKQAGGFFDTLRGKVGGLATSLKSPALSSGILQGVGLGAGLFMFQGITSAIEGAASMLGDFVKMAIEEDKGIAQLNASLKANVPNWQDQTTAVQGAIDAAEKLAFTDDAARQSMALLLPATHDVAKAVELQSIAMNLARLRGTGLVETTTLISKVYQGNLTSLKRFGISLKGVSTSTQALAKIQELAAGQAEAYANTTAGHYEEIQIKINDLKEDIGHKLQPVIDIALQGLADLFNPQTPQINTALAALIKSTEQLQGVSGNASVGMQGLSDSVQKLVDQAGPAAASMLQFGQTVLAGKSDVAQMDILLSGLGQQAGLTAADIETLSNEVIAGNLTLTQAIDILQTLAAQQARHNDALARTKANTDDAAASTDRLTQAQARYQARLEALAHSPGVNVGKLITFPKAQTIEQQAEGIGKAFSGGIKQGLDANVRAVALASANLQYAVKHPFAILNAKGGFGWLTGQLQSAGLAKGLASKNPEIRAEAEAKRAIIVNALSQMPSFAWGSKIAADYLAGLRAQGLIRTPYGWGPAFEGNPFGQYPTGGPPHGGHTRARGGPVWPGTWTVGENGPEKMTINRNGTGYVTPNAGGGGGGGNTIGPITVNVMGSVAAGEGHAMGQSIVAGVLVELARMRTLPIGRPA
jgi:hypothetical protein